MPCDELATPGCNLSSPKDSWAPADPHNPEIGIKQVKKTDGWMYYI